MEQLIRFGMKKSQFIDFQGNILIADVFFKARYIEAWGRGIEKINE
jgi:predicted HTH transcriptional regulator